MTRRVASRFRIAKTSRSFAAALWIALASSASAGDGLTITWTNNMLTVAADNLPGGKVDTWYLEAFCRSGAWDREWHLTTIPHRTELIAASPDRKHIRLRSVVEPNVEVLHEIRAGADEVDFRLEAANRGGSAVDVSWFQPCMRVDRFTGRAQANYTSRSFIFTERGFTWLDKTRRTGEARYRGGQVYVPKGVKHADVNPRPISLDAPVNDLIGCVSADDKYLLATAWDQTHELFQGVIVCIHNDPRIGGLKAGETKRLRGKLYFMKNDPEALLARYRKDFGK